MRNLTSSELLVEIKNLVAQERAITLRLIECLEECQARRLYAELGYASLWEFATVELGLSEGAAQRRIQAMRFAREVPEAKRALADGSLSLSNAAKVQSFRQAEKKQGRVHDGHALLQEVAQVSQRECERRLFEISPEALPQDRERQVSANGDRELKLVVSAELYDKLQRLRGHLAHALPEASYVELLERLVDSELARIEKKKGLDLDPVAAIAAATTAAAAVNPLPAGKRVYIPVALKKAAWSRGRGQCEVTVQGRRCSSRHRVEVEHVIELALGGANTLDNLQLACREHNLRKAIQNLGQEVMAPFVGSLRHVRARGSRSPAQNSSHPLQNSLDPVRGLG